MKKEEIKLTKRQIQALNTRKIILDSAVALMEESNFDEITIEDISRKAGVSVGAFYHYFKSKYDIFVEAFDRADNHFKTRVANKLNSKSPIENIKTYFRHYAKLNSDVGLDTLRLLFNSSNKVFVTKGRYLQTLLADLVQEGQKNGEITDEMSYDEIVEYLFTMARGVAFHWCVSNAGFDIRKKMPAYIDRIISTIKK